MSTKSETLQLRGTLEGHNGWVTSLATCESNPDILVSGSRDKSVMVWQLTPGEENYGVAKRSLRGHSHIVEDVSISHDGTFVLSASWDKTMRLWDVNDGTSVRFVGHEGDVMSCAFSPDQLMVVSASRDKTVRMWNVIGDLLFTFEGANSHQDWVTGVRMTPSDLPKIVSASHDKTVKVLDVKDGSISAEFVGHNNFISALALSPDGTLAATGGKDGQILIWDVQSSKYNYELPCGDEITALAFSPSRYWLAAATASGIKIYNLKERKVIEELKPETFSGAEPTVLSLAWSSDGQVLYSGYTDSAVRVWQVMTSV